MTLPDTSATVERQWQKWGTLDGEQVPVSCDEDDAEMLLLVATGTDKHGQEWGVQATIPIMDHYDMGSYEKHVTEQLANSVMDAIDKADRKDPE